MSCIIERSNGIVVQHWQDNDAAWRSLKIGHAFDVQWKNATNPQDRPKEFRNRGQAEWYLDKRAQLLGSPETRWTYEIKEVE